jgi:hypothetical protein
MDKNYNPTQRFWEYPVKISVDDYGMLVFPEVSDTLERVNQLIGILPPTPKVVISKDKTSEENRDARELIIARWSVQCVGLLLPYFREDIRPTAEQHEDIKYWQALKEEFLQTGGDVPMIISSCKQRFLLEDTVGKKFATFPLTPDQFVELEDTSTARRKAAIDKVVYMSSPEFKTDLPGVREGKMINLDEKLERATSTLWRVLTLNLDYIDPITIRSIRKKAGGVVKNRRESIAEHLSEFRQSEYLKYCQSSAERPYKLPRKFKSQFLNQ